MKKDEKQSVMTQFQSHATDTGSSSVQIALLTKKITSLTAHLQEHKKDKHSRRGLIGMVGRRRKLLRTMQGDNAQYTSIIRELGIRK